MFWMGSKKTTFPVLHTFTLLSGGLIIGFHMSQVSYQLRASIFHHFIEYVYFCANYTWLFNGGCSEIIFIYVQYIYIF